MVGQEDLATGIRNTAVDEKERGVNVSELALIYEAALADEWEELNRPNKDIFPEWNSAVKKVESARELLKEAVEALKDAAKMIPDTGDDDRINSLADEIEFLAGDVEKQKGRMT